MQEKKTFEQLKKDRFKKLESIQKAGINAYPSKTVRTHTILEAKSSFKSLSKEEKEVVIAGRVTGKRGHGKLSFADVEDESGKIQLMLKSDVLGKKSFDLFQDTIERGDFIEAKGKCFLTKMGEKTLEVSKWNILTKTLLPLPEKWSGLKNQEIRYRKRYLDLLMNKEAREKFKKRTLFIEELRKFLLKENFTEVETPILQPLAGGATARPFITHHNALGQDYFLRIAPELYLKRLIIGGYEKVFEIARNFRNEGISTQHNPDFTMLEFYWAYADYGDLMEFTEKMLEEIVPKISGSLKVEHQGKTIDFKSPFPRVKFRDLLIKELGIDVKKVSEKELKALAKKEKIKMEKGIGKAKLIDEIYKKKVKNKIKGPLFVIDYPTEMIPLAKRKEDDKDEIASFQLLIDGAEIVKAYNELNDPKEQKKRFKEQAKGDKEAHPVDKEYLEALSYGMPPTAGFGMGIDRLLVILLNQQNIRDVILFPLRRREKDE